MLVGTSSNTDFYLSLPLIVLPISDIDLISHYFFKCKWQKIEWFDINLCSLWQLDLIHLERHSSPHFTAWFKLDTLLISASTACHQMFCDDRQIDQDVGVNIIQLFAKERKQLTLPSHCHLSNILHRQPILEQNWGRVICVKSQPNHPSSFWK